MTGGSAGVAPTRTLVVWVPDWPVIAAGGSAPAAVVHAGAVLACDAAAREAGVRRGQRVRDAQARCPELCLAPADSARDMRAFSPLVAVLEERAPGVQIVRPGLGALRVRGPARYYGGERAAADVLLGALREAGEGTARVGIADGLFTAVTAARLTSPDAPVHIVRAGGSAGFLAPLPVAVLDDAGPVGLLARLGVRTLGAFAALDATRVAERFGPDGLRLHALAAGADARPVVPRTPPPDLEQEAVFEPPVTLADQVAFGVRRVAEEFVAGLSGHGLVCTGLRVVFDGAEEERTERVWLHPGVFDAAAVVDRVRWQLAESADLRSGVVRVRLVPETVDAAVAHRPAMFGGVDEKVHHALSRVQAMLGHRGVVTPAVGGGRLLSERRLFTPWGDRGTVTDAADRPWPGSPPPPAPAAVYAAPFPVEVTAVDGRAVTVDERGFVSAPPAWVSAAGRCSAVTAWAGPWPLDERPWDPARARFAHRFQLVDADRRAWLLLCEGGRWQAEARYD